MSASESSLLRDVQVAVALIQKGEQILLVRQQAAHSSRIYWTLPAGKVEPLELVYEGLVREIREETGIRAHAPFRPLYNAQCLSVPRQTRWTTFAYEIPNWEGELNPNDPDGLILEARFHDRAKAIELINEYQPMRVMKEPVLSCLRKELVTGSSWFYRINANHEEELLQCLVPVSPQRP